MRELFLFIFIIDKPSCYKVLCQLETIHYKKIYKSVWKTFAFHSENDKHEEFDFNGKTLNFTLQLVKNLTLFPLNELPKN